MYDRKNKGEYMLLDEMRYGITDGTPNRLFLERKLYSRYPNEYLLARWVSVERAQKEEL